MTASQTPAHTNRLARETSPYLLQHAHNPVDWHPWGPEALQRAKREDKPILLSIGYATCHWCHVMERESFENEDIAALMNRHFVCIKVDREERPDLDEIYMTATVAMSGHGGWPMTVFLTPDQQPFFAGTYFPAEDRYGRPGFPTLLERIAELWQSDRQGLVEQASQLTRQVRAQSQAMRPAPVGAELLEQAVKQLAGEFDETHGGFGGAPKFPPSASLALLLRHHHHTRDAHALHMVRRTLDAMKGGGIYDQIGGGFARYATDAEWLVPHFEKMLYDNGLLARVYLEAFQVTEEPEYRRIAVETLDYALREMQSNEGGFFSATDADSEGEEGKFFVWSPGEIHDVIGDREQAEAVCRYFDVTDAGNWEGTNILHTPRSMEEVARELGLSAQRLQEVVAEAKPKLYAARLKRVPPLLDDKILVSWNALMIRALAEGYRSLGNEAYLQAAEQASRYILEHMRREDGGLFRTARDGRAQLDAYLEDYAFFADALIDLYEAGGSARYLGDAEKLAERMVTDFADPDGGGFFFTAASHEQLIVRNREGHDGALPNANAVAARALARLSFHLDRDAFREQAEQAVRAYGRFMERAPRAFATSLGVADLLLRGPVEAALVGTHGDPAYEALRMELGRHYLPNRILAHADPSAPASIEPAPSARPLLEGKGPVDGKPALYVCRDFACKAPVTAPGDVAAALEQTSKVAEEEKRRALSGHKLAGVATKEGTARYAQRFEARFGRQAYGTLGELTVSGLGFGTYRVDDMTPEHREALKKALSEGVNLIDTSTNYTDGHSERLVGEVIDELSGKELQRDQVVVVSKVGYVQGQNLEIAKRHESEGKPLPDMVKLGDELWHCIAPEWLQDQLGRSLDRLGLQTLDFCLLHNPEYFLAQAAQQEDGTLEAHREEFYARLKRAFEHLEGEVKAGRIGGYGVSSNTAGQPASHPEATSLARMLEAAREAGGADHHFRVLQLPLNLLEPGAALEQSEPDARSVLELAEKEHVAVLVNRPLNAIRGRRLVRLADPPELAEAPAFREQLREVAGLEREFREKIGSKLRAAEGAAVDPGDLFRWSEHLAHQPEQVDSLHQWLEIERQAIVPQLAQVFSMLDEVLANALGATWMDWRKQYEQAFQKLMQAMRSEAAKKSEAQARAVREAIDPALPEALRDARLSHKALQTLRSTAGVTTVLLGMRNPHYVEDALELMKQQPDLDARAVYEAAKQIELPETE